MNPASCVVQGKTQVIQNSNVPNDCLLFLTDFL